MADLLVTIIVSLQERFSFACESFKSIYLVLPQVHYQHYQELKQALEQFKANVTQVEAKGTDLASTCLEIQNFFQLQVVNLSSDGLTLETENKVRSYQTEIHKQLRLLSTDLMFLQVAQQVSTVEQRRTQVYHRLETLIGYCKVLLQNC